MSNFLRKTITTIFFVSGASGLVYEVVWSRMLSTILGSDVMAVSIVTAVFMAGLAVGACFFGHLADRVKTPLRIYALLEAGTGISALASIVLFPLLNDLYLLLMKVPGEPKALAVKAVLAAAVLFIPTFLMGGTLPVMSRFITHNLKNFGDRVGCLYGVNTLGAVTGCMISGFYLIEKIGLAHTIELAAFFNVLIAFICLFICKSSETELSRTPSVLHQDNDLSISKNQFRVILFCYMIAGFTSLAYEVIWTRVLSNVFLTTSYAFSSMLSTYLVGLALGSLLIRKVSDHTEFPILLFALIEMSIGFWALGTVPVFAKLPEIVGTLSANRGSSWFYHSMIRFGISSLITVPPSLLMGMAFPLVSRICVIRTKKAGSSVGTVYTLNTIGCIAGSISTGFILLPRLGLQNSIICMATLNVGIGVFCAFFSKTHFKTALKTTVTVSLAFLTLFWIIPENMMSRSVAQRLRTPWKLAYYHEGVDNSTMVFKNEKSGVFRMMANFHQYIGDNSRTMTRIQKWQAHLPLLLAEKTQKVLIIGGGTGITANAASLYGSDLTCCEMSRGVLEASRYFSRENGNFLNGDRVKIVREDGRNYLLQTDRCVNVIVGDLYNAAMSGMVNLYTRDYYSLCREHLLPGGLMCQWISMKDFPEDALKGVMATFRSAFPHTSFWFASPDIIAMIGGREQLHLNLRRINNRMKQAPLRGELRKIGLNDPYHLLAHFLMNEEDGASFSANAKIITDDFPYIEYSIPRSMHYLSYKKDMPLFLREINTLRSRTVPANKKKLNAMEKALERCYKAKGHVFEGYALFLEGHPLEARKECTRALSLYPLDVDALLLRQSTYTVN